MVLPFASLLRRSKSVDPARFQTFLGRQAAYVAQKSVLDYCRVKAGRREKELFSDPDFQVALLHCRWQTFLGTAVDLVALAEAWLRPHARPGREAALADALGAMGAKVLSADPPPESEREARDAAIAALPAHLVALQAKPPLGADQMPLCSEAPLLATLPIHPDQRRGETPSIRGGLRFLIVSAQQEMERGFDAPPLCARLLQEA